MIRGWVDSLRQGDVEQAASYFAIPSVAENGPVLIRITAAQRRRALQPVAALRRAPDPRRDRRPVHDRDLPPHRAAGARDAAGREPAATAKTSFVIRDGKIVQWRRVGATPEPAPGQSA